MMRPKSPVKPAATTVEAAEALALQGLTFLVADSQRLSRFLALTGIDPGDLRSWEANPHLRAAVLEHFLSDESLLLVFTAEARIPPQTVGEAYSLLTGPVE